MSFVIVLGIGLFMALLVLLLAMMPKPSAGGVLLEQVTRQTRDRVGMREEASWLNADLVAKPFTLFRSLFSAEPNPALVRRLSLAGYRRPSHADIFLGLRLALPAVLGFSAALIFSDNIVIFFLLAVVLGYAINARRQRIKLSLPDGLDLLSICMEAGLGIDQGIVRVGQELQLSHRDLSDELMSINFEQRAGVQRMAAWQSFADRANVESVRSFVAMLIQTDRFGTPIAKSLSNFSDALRIQRRQQAEEMAAKTS